MESDPRTMAGFEIFLARSINDIFGPQQQPEPKPRRDDLTIAKLIIAAKQAAEDGIETELRIDYED